MSHSHLFQGEILEFAQNETFLEALVVHFFGFQKVDAGTGYVGPSGVGYRFEGIVPIEAFAHTATVVSLSIVYGEKSLLTLRTCSSSLLLSDT